MSSHTADEVAQQPINLFVIHGITEFVSQVRGDNFAPVHWSRWLYRAGLE